jgi:hypothetical protein
MSISVQALLMSASWGAVDFGKLAPAVLALAEEA